MTEQRNQLRNQLADLFAACWKDEALKQRFMSDPKGVLAEYGMDVPDGIDVNIIENTDTTVHITMPAPPSGGMDLSDDELSNAAGGVSYLLLFVACPPPAPPSSHRLTPQSQGGACTD